MNSSRSPDETYRLDAATRAGVAPQFDVAALERLLQHLDPVGRPIVLEEFLLASRRTAPPEPNHWRLLRGFADSQLNELLAEVWQPFWAAQPDDALDDPTSPYPGRELARKRRRAARHLVDP